MLVFIDDSGDPGFKLEKGSSHFFVISAVLFDDNLEAEKTAVAIKELKRELGFVEDVEFKFNNSRKIVRERFLSVVNTFNFKIRCIVIDKRIIRSDELRTNKKSFYAYAIKMLLKHNGNEISNARIKIDGSGDREFRKNFLTYLRRELNSNTKCVVENCRLVDSRGNVLVQLADMVAGAIRRSYSDDKTDKDIYKGIIQKHITSEWRFK